MKAAAAGVLLGALAVSAAPLSSTVAKRDVSNRDVLQYALELENLESAYYTWGLGKWSAQDFTDAGFPDWVRGRMLQIAQHESHHVQLLSEALGDSANRPCDYNFAFASDVESFVIAAALLEQVGTSAYVGAIGNITDASAIVGAASIATTEGRHQAWLTSAVLKDTPWSGPEDTPISFNEAYSIVTLFTNSCPGGNEKLPFTAYPRLYIDDHGNVNSTANTDGTYVLVSSGFSNGLYPVKDGKADLPEGQGLVYAVLTTAATMEEAADYSKIVAGPVIGWFPFNSSASNPPPSFQ